MTTSKLFWKIMYDDKNQHVVSIKDSSQVALCYWPLRMTCVLFSARVIGA
jgi:hypothetical protein